MSTSLSPDQLLGHAQDGNPEHLGQLLENYRHYLHLLARLEIGGVELRLKVPSDLKTRQQAEVMPVVLQ